MHPPFASLRRIGVVVTSLAVPLAVGTLTRAQAPATPTEPASGVRPAGRAAGAAVTDTNELLVFLEPGTDANAYARDHGLRLLYRLVSDPNACVFTPARGTRAAEKKAVLKQDKRSKRVFDNPIIRRSPRAFVPNDPYFPGNTPSAAFPGQWHLVNSYFAGRDVNVQGAWNRDTTGVGVTIGIVDDGLQWAHPDLSPNYVAARSYDFGQNDGDPSPVSASDNHGTSVAGVAAARGGNGIGVTGAAPFASLAGLRIDFSGAAAQFVDAVLYRSSGATRDIQVKNHSYGPDDTYVESDAELFAFQQSAAAGTLHTVAAGNSRPNPSEDSGKQAVANSPDVITVAAMGSNGKFSDYSNYGACVFVTAPSSSADLYGITTTDRTGAAGYNATGPDDEGADAYPDLNYTSTFGGTSSAAPLVAGVLGLVKQVRPDMNVRLLKHLLVLTSDVVDPTDATVTSDGGWKTNAVGRKFNQNYGFGKIDAEELTRLAPQYSVSPLTTATVATTTVNAAVPDNNATGVARAFNVTATTPLEEVQVTLNVTHAKRDDLEAYLTSPSGTTSRLVRASNAPAQADLAWTFTTNAFWGENPQGSWTLKVVDALPQSGGTWNSYAVTLRMGTAFRLFTLSGTVTANGAPLAGVTVTATGGATKTGTTNANGVYQITGLAEGNYNVSASKTGYSFTPASQPVSMTADRTVNFTANAASWLAADVAQSNDGSTRILMLGGSELRVQKWNGTMQVGPSYTPAANWAPVALAADGVGRTFILLKNGTTSYQLWIMNATGGRAAALATQAAGGWTATDVSAAGDGTARVLLVSPTGQAKVVKISGNTVTAGPVYTPAAGWSPTGVAAGADNKTRLLWRNGTTNYQLWTLNAACVRETAHPVQSAAGLTAREVSQAGDGTTRVLLVSATRQIRVNRHNGSTVQVGPLYTPSSGYGAVAISADPDTSGKTRLLWQHTNGTLNLWTLGATGALQSSAAL